MTDARQDIINAALLLVARVARPKIEGQPFAHVRRRDIGRLEERLAVLYDVEAYRQRVRELDAEGRRLGALAATPEPQNGANR